MTNELFECVMPNNEYKILSWHRSIRNYQDKKDFSELVKNI